MRLTSPSRRLQRSLSIAFVLGLASAWFPGCGASTPPPSDAAQSSAIIQEEVHIPTDPKAKKR